MPRATRTWDEVRPEIDAEIEKIKRQLVDAPLDKVPGLQTRARILMRLHQRFEITGPDDRRVGDDPHY